MNEPRLAAVVGAGLMGHGIAQVLAAAGLTVTLHDVDPARLEPARQAIRDNLDLFVRQGLTTPDAAAGALARVRLTSDLAGAVAEAGVVIEAVYEDLALKQSIFGRLAGLCPPHTLMASNTSGLSVNRIAEGSPCPERVLVAHFWNPPHLIPIVEVVPGLRTAAPTTQGIIDLLRRCGKRPVLVKKDIPGHIGNRLQFALLREALSLVENGVASAEDVDAVVEMSLGRRLPVTGPLKSADLGGLDLFLAIASYLFKDLDRSARPPRLLSDPVARGHLGAKTGSGLFDWPGDTAAAARARRDAELIRWLKVMG